MYTEEQIKELRSICADCQKRHITKLNEAKALKEEYRNDIKELISGLYNDYKTPAQAAKAADDLAMINYCKGVNDALAYIAHILRFDPTTGNDCYTTK